MGRTSKLSKAVLVPVGLTGLLLTGCSGTPGPTVTETVTVQPKAEETTEPPRSEDVVLEPTEEPAQESELTERGNIPKQIGEEAGLIGSDGVPFATFTINEITVDPGCTEQYAEPPENGHFVFLDTTVKTKPNLIEEYGASFSLSYGWKAIGTDGVTSNAVLDSFSAFVCIPETQQLPTDIGPAETANGIIVLDVEDPAGILVYEDMMMMEGGWEWEYGK